MNTGQKLHFHPTQLGGQKIPGTAVVCVIQEGSLIMMKKEFLLQVGISPAESFIGMTVLANLLESH